MATITHAATLDGVTDFTVMGTVYEWDTNRFLSTVDRWGGTGPDINVFALTLQGDFYLGALRLPGSMSRTVIVDTNDGIGRDIDFMRLGGLGGTVTLTTTHVGTLTSSGPGAVTLSIGSAGMESLFLGGANNRVTVSSFLDSADFGSGKDSLKLLGDGHVNNVDMGNGDSIVSVANGWINMLLTADGNDTITVGSGYIQALSMGRGANKLSIGSGNVNSVLAWEGNDTVTVGAGGWIDSMNLGGGGSNVTLAAGAGISSFQSGDGNDNVTLNGSSRIFLLKLDGGNNTVTSANGNIESYYSYGGNNTLNIGAGGIQQVVLSGDGGTHVVNATGFVGSLQVYDNATTTVNLSGDADAIMLGEGNDRVTTGNGYVQLINAGDGNNIITLGTGGAGFIRTGDGDDLFRLNTLNPVYGVVLQGGGGSGTNTADFSQIGVAITVSFNRYDYQSIGDLTGADDPSIGYFSFVQFQNMLGTGLGDRLEGNESGNRLSGGLGNDTLSGLAGSDVMIGGRGNDSLTGGADADTFEFSAGGGRDRVSGFVAGVDAIDFTNAVSMASITFASFGTGVLLTVGTTEVVVENTTVAVMNDAGNFIF